mgnify:CR=1 FL=1
MLFRSAGPVTDDHLNRAASVEIRHSIGRMRSRRRDQRASHGDGSERKPEMSHAQFLPGAPEKRTADGTGAILAALFAPFNIQAPAIFRRRFAKRHGSADAHSSAD